MQNGEKQKKERIRGSEGCQPTHIIQTKFSKARNLASCPGMVIVPLTDITSLLLSFGLPTGFPVSTRSQLCTYCTACSNRTVSRRCQISYLKRLRELNKEYALEQDPVKRVEILDRMLFLLEARSRERRADLESKGGPTESRRFNGNSLLVD